MKSVKVTCSVCGKVLRGQPRSTGPLGYHVPRHKTPEGKNCLGYYRTNHKVAEAAS